MKLPLILAGGLAALAVLALGNTIFDANRRADVTPVTRPVIHAESPQGAGAPSPVGPFAVFSPPATTAPPPTPAPAAPAAPAPPAPAGHEDD